MSSEAVKREAERGKKMFQDYARSLEAQRERSRSMFPSTLEGDRGAVSPLGGLAEWPWGGERKGD
jgi:hypothetical protein